MKSIQSSIRTSSRVVTELVVICVLIIGSGSALWAASLFVANHGVDSGACGGSGSPCRSISQAISNAVPGDTIIVGPGRYGDLNDDGDTGDPGEENSGDPNILIDVNKQLTVISSSGAAATVIDPNDNSISAVLLSANGVVFGSAKKGFTLTGGENGLVIGNGTTGTLVAANIAVGNDLNGFQGRGEGNQLTGNLALRNGDDGFTIVDNNLVLVGNVSSSNGEGGFGLGGSGHTVKGNISTGNADDGITVTGTGHVITGNSIVGNFGQGVDLNTPGSSATVTKNNIYGNGGNLANCGLFNGSGGVITATDNFWGSADGPGTDPADAVCTGLGGTTTTTPFAPKAIKVKIKSQL